MSEGAGRNLPPSICCTGPFRTISEPIWRKSSSTLPLASIDTVVGGTAPRNAAKGGYDYGSIHRWHFGPRKK
jgi:hypothetical protein